MGLYFSIFKDILLSWIYLLFKEGPMAEHDPPTPKTPDRFCELIGLRFTAMEPGFCRTELTVQESHLNPYGTLHGGVVYSLADTAMGGALSTLLSERERCATIEIKINYLKVVREGRLVCETRVRQKGKSIAFLEAVILDEEGAVAATASGTFRVFVPSRPKDGYGPSSG
jgi:acyl-CoA thioesterase